MMSLNFQSRMGFALRFLGVAGIAGLGVSTSLAQCAAGREYRCTQTTSGLVETIRREIRDPHDGARWVIVANKKHPAGPGRMILADDASETGDCFSVDNPLRAVIHVGDRVLVEEHTATAEAYLEAAALGTAGVGGRLDVRLKIGGKVVRVVALAPGRAFLVSAGEEKP